MNSYCLLCRKDYPEEVFCPVHLTDLEAYVSPPSVAQESTSPTSPEHVAMPTAWSTSVCWNCGTNSPSSSNTTCLATSCRKRLVPPALLIRFPDGQIELDLGEQAVLGRAGAHSLLFERFPNVSRYHALVGIDTNQEAWIVPTRTPNGTFVNGTEVSEGLRHVLRISDRIRLASVAEGSVVLFSHEPKPKR